MLKTLIIAGLLGVTMLAGKCDIDVNQSGSLTQPTYAVIK